MGELRVREKCSLVADSKKRKHGSVPTKSVSNDKERRRSWTAGLRHIPNQNTDDLLLQDLKVELMDAEDIPSPVNSPSMHTIQINEAGSPRYTPASVFFRV